MLNPKLSGFTSYELIIVLAIILIITSVAMPNMSNALINSNLKDAEATVIKSLRMAKNIAQTENQNIIVRFYKGTSNIQLQQPNKTTILQIPNKTKLLTDKEFIYSPFGTISALGDIDIYSTLKPNKTKKIQIVSLIGQLSTK